MPYATRNLNITQKPMGPTAGPGAPMGALTATVVPVPLIPVAPQPATTTFESFWSQWGDVIFGLTVVWGIVAALPGRRNT